MKIVIKPITEKRTDTCSIFFIDKFLFNKEAFLKLCNCYLHHINTSTESGMVLVLQMLENRIPDVMSGKLILPQLEVKQQPQRVEIKQPSPSNDKDIIL